MSAIKRDYVTFSTSTPLHSTFKTATKTKKVTKDESGTSSTMRVYARFRTAPPGESVEDLYGIDFDENSVALNKTTDAILRNGGKTKFFFNEIFTPTATQKDIARSTCIPLISDLFIRKKSSLIFSYGVTNAGKTHTIIGTRENPGILPRSFVILNQIKNFIDKNWQNPYAILDLGDMEFAMSSVYCLGQEKELTITSANLYFEAFEIYNEDIYDLLPSASDRKLSVMNRPKLQIREKENRQIYIKDLNRIEVESQEAWTTLLENSLANRTVGDNNINYRSSRSHTFFRFIMRLNYSSPQTTHHLELTLCVVDLAGAERAKKTANSGLELAEAGKINQSLLILARCIKALSDPNPSTIVPYRDCKLTRILFEYLNENSNLAMIANINPVLSDFEESLRVLNYAAQSKEILPIRSKVDSIRKSVINFPYAALNRSKIAEESTNDAFSLFSNEDTILKGFLEDKENFPLNFEQKIITRQGTSDSNDAAETLQSKLKQHMQEISEKDERIQLLEEQVKKLQQNSSVDDMTARLLKVNETTKKDALNYFSNNPLPNLTAECLSEEFTEKISQSKKDMSAYNFIYPTLNNRAVVNFFVFSAVDDTLLSTLLKNIDKSPNEINLSQLSVSKQQLAKLQNNCSEDFETDVEQKRNLENVETTKNQQKANRKSQKNKKRKGARKSKVEQLQESSILENLEISKQTEESQPKIKKTKNKRAQNKEEEEINMNDETPLVNQGPSPIAKRLRERPRKLNTYYTTDL